MACRHRKRQPSAHPGGGNTMPGHKRAKTMARFCFCRGSRLLAIVVFLGAVTIPTTGKRVRGRSAAAAAGGNPRSGKSAAAQESRQTPSRLVDGYRSSPTSLSSLLSFPALSSSSSRPPPSYLSGALRTRGGSKVAPPKKTNRGTGSSSKPILGPITRQSAADSAAKDDKALEDGQQEFSPQFLDFQSRVGFMKKVYLTVSVQLIYTGLVCTLMRGYREQILRLLFGHGAIPQVLFFVSTMATIIGTQAVMWNNVELRQSFPKNLPLLTAFTSAWAFYVGVFALMFTQGSVIRAVFQAAFVVGSLTAYAFRTNPKHELTQLGAGLYSAGNALGMFCLMKLFFFRGHRASDLAISCLATLFFSLYLVYDTYRIIGGKHRKSGMFGVKDWAIAAMALYEDIMQIFIHLLALFGETQ